MRYRRKIVHYLTCDPRYVKSQRQGKLRTKLPPMTSVPASVLPVSPRFDDDDAAPEFFGPSQLVTGAVTEKDNCFTHREFPLRRDPTRLSLTEQQTAVS